MHINPFFIQSWAPGRIHFYTRPLMVASPQAFILSANSQQTLLHRPLYIHGHPVSNHILTHVYAEFERS